MAKHGGWHGKTSSAKKINKQRHVWHQWRKPTAAVGSGSRRMTVAASRAKSGGGGGGNG